MYSVGDAVISLSADLSPLRPSLMQAEREVQASGGRMEGAFKGAGNAAGLLLGGAVLAGGAALVGGFVAAGNAAAGFEEKLSGIKAVSGATSDEMGRLSGLALQLGKDTAFSASEAAAGIEELIKGGLTIPDIMNGAAEATLNLAAAGGVSLPEAATLSANALAQFNLKGEDMAHVADLIAGAANASALDVSQFGYSLQAAGAVAATVGFTFDDLAQGIAIMGKAGITGSDAGTSLKTMMLNLQPTTNKAALAMEELGILTTNATRAMELMASQGITPVATDAVGLKQALFQTFIEMTKMDPKATDISDKFTKWQSEMGLLNNAFFTAEGRVKSMAEVAEILQTSTSELTQAQRLQALQTIFGSDAIRAAAVFAKEGEEGFNGMADAMGKVTAASVGAERLNNTRGSIQQLMGSLETFAIIAAQTFLPAFRGAIDAATAGVNALIPVVEGMGPAIEQMGAAWGSVAGAVGVVNQFFNDNAVAAGALSAVMGGLGAIVAAQTAVYVAHAATTGAVTLATNAWRGAQLLLNLALSANPIGLVVVALGALVGALVYAYNNSEEFRAVVDQAFSTLREGVTAALEGIQTAIRWTVETWEAAQRGIESINAAVTGSVEASSNAVRGAIDGAWSFARGVVDAQNAAIFGTIQRVWDAIPPDVQQELTALTGAVQKAFELEVQIAAQNMESIRTDVSTKWGAVQTATTNTLTAVTGFVQGQFTAHSTKASEEYTKIQTSISGALDEVNKKSNEIWGGVTTKVGEELGKMLTAVKTWGTDTLNHFGTLIQPFLDKGKELGQNLIDGVVGVIEGAKEMLKDAIRNIVLNILRGLKDFIEQWVKDRVGNLLPGGGGEGSANAAHGLPESPQGAGLGSGMGLALADTGEQPAAGATYNVNVYETDVQLDEERLATTLRRVEYLYR